MRVDRRLSKGGNRGRRRSVFQSVFALETVISGVLLFRSGSRTGNRQFNAAIHRTAVTHIRRNPDAAAAIARRLATGNTVGEARRALKRRISDVIYRALLADAITWIGVLGLTADRARRVLIGA